MEKRAARLEMCRISARWLLYGYMLQGLRDAWSWTSQQVRGPHCLACRARAAVGVGIHLGHRDLVLIIAEPERRVLHYSISFRCMQKCMRARHCVYVLCYLCLCMYVDTLMYLSTGRYGVYSVCLPQMNFHFFL